MKITLVFDIVYKPSDVFLSIFPLMQIVFLIVVVVVVEYCEILPARIVSIKLSSVLN